MSGDTQSRHCLWLMLAASLLHIADTGSGYVGHTRRLLSPAPETMVVPSGLNATLVTKLVWPGSGWPTGRPVTASHNRTDPSMLPEAINLPSGLNATLNTTMMWPVSGWPTGFPVSASHTRTVASPPPETIRLPSGLNATLATASGLAGPAFR